MISSEARRPQLLLSLLTGFVLLSTIVLTPGSVRATHGSNAPLFYPFLHPMTGLVTERVDSSVQGQEHDGYDIQAPTYDRRVYASWFGKVTFADGSACLGDYGCRVDIEHKNGYVTRYAHLAKGSVAVSVNSYVSPMQQIGSEGDTGNAFGAHLHFEILKNGVPLNVNSKISDNQWSAAGSPISFTNTWILNDGPDATSGPTYAFGRRGDIPLTGDWDCDGFETAGLVRVDESTGAVQWFFNDEAWTGAAPDGPVSWGSRGDIPIVGDWDGDGCDEPGVRKAGSNLWIFGQLSLAGSGSITEYKRYNWASAKHWPIAGAWKTTSTSQSCATPPKAGVGVTFINATTGAFEWHFDYELDAATNRSFAFGTRGDHPLVGHWDNLCRHGIAVARTNASNNAHEWHVRYNLTSTSGGYAFSWATSNDFSLALDWDTDSFTEFGIAR